MHQTRSRKAPRYAKQFPPRRKVLELRQKVVNESGYVNGLRWSILHVLPADSPDADIDALETLAKRKLGTRIIGLNKN